MLGHMLQHVAGRRALVSELTRWVNAYLLTTDIDPLDEEQVAAALRLGVQFEELAPGLWRLKAS